MIYFSEIRGKKIFTEDNIPVGILDDLIFLALETPQITKLVIKDLAKNTLIVTIDALINCFCVCKTATKKLPSRENIVAPKAIRRRFSVWGAFSNRAIAGENRYPRKRINKPITKYALNASFKYF